jgi:thioredoxin reductase/ferredoxin
VEVFEARSEVGGMLRWAIPEYRLPSAVLQRELEVFAKLGVTLRTGRRLGESLQWQELDRFDAVFLATGAWQQRPLKVEGVQREGVMSGLSYLEQERAGRAPVLGRRVSVIGGGNTAIDAARTARRKGAVVDVYYDVLLAIPEEVTAARDEGIVFHHQVVPASFAEGATNRVELRLRGLTTGGDVDSTESNEADTVLVCVGGVADLSNLDEAHQGLVKDGRLAIDAWGRTRDRRIFAGGDASSAGTGTVVGAINSGKRAAVAIHEMLSGASLDIEASGSESGAGIVAAAGDDGMRRAAQIKSPPGPEGIRLQFFRKVPRAKVQHRAPNDSVWNFEEVNLGLGTTQAKHEAGERCFHCGVCTHCDICVDVCPTGAISKFDGKYRINAELCTGCRVCAAECPRSAIEMPATGFCIACGYCTTWFECPSLLKGSDGIVYIDRRTCIDCGICIQVCAQGAIRPMAASEIVQ